MNILNTGDLIFFTTINSGGSSVKFFTLSNFTHVGIIYICPITNIIYIWEVGEASGSKIVITRDKKATNASHLIPFDIKIKSKYVKEIYIRKLITNEFIQDKMTKFIAENIGKNYDYNLAFGYFKQGFIFTDFNLIQYLSIPEATICSELVIETYKYLDILKIRDFSTIKSYYPKHFSNIEKDTNIIINEKQFRFDVIKKIIID